MAEKPGIQLVKDRHRSREFIEFLELLDAAYPAHTAIRLIPDNHSAHICRKAKGWLAYQPAHRCEFAYTPKCAGSTSSRHSFPTRPLRPAPHPRLVQTGTQAVYPEMLRGTPLRRAARKRIGMRDLLIEDDRAT